MARLPDGYSLNGGLAFRGAPAHGNPNARQLFDGDAASQLGLSIQQEFGRQRLNRQTQASQLTGQEQLDPETLASGLAAEYKSATQRLLKSIVPGAFEATEALATNPGALADVASQMQV